MSVVSAKIKLTKEMRNEMYIPLIGEVGSMAIVECECVNGDEVYALITTTDLVCEECGEPLPFYTD